MPPVEDGGGGHALAATTQDRDGAVVVRPTGELDVTNSRELEDALAGPLSRGVPHVVADLSAVGFLDSSTLGVLVSVHKRAAARGAVLSIVRPGPDFDRMLAITGLDRVLRLAASVEEACASDGSPS